MRNIAIQLVLQQCYRKGSAKKKKASADGIVGEQLFHVLKA